MTVREHKKMLACSCSEADRLYCVCLFCGKVKLPDPAWAVVLFAAVFFTAHLYWWWAL